MWRAELQSANACARGEVEQGGVVSGYKATLVVPLIGRSLAFGRGSGWPQMVDGTRTAALEFSISLEMAPCPALKKQNVTPSASHVLSFRSRREISHHDPKQIA